MGFTKDIGFILTLLFRSREISNWLNVGKGQS